MRLLFVLCVVLVGLLGCGVLVCPVGAYTGENVAPIDHWGVYSGGYGHYGDGVQISGSVIEDGRSAVYSDAHTAGDANIWREIDSEWIPLSVGDHVYMSAWIKTSVAVGQPYGGRIACDFFAYSSVDGWSMVDGVSSSGEWWNAFSMAPYPDPVSYYESTTGECIGYNVMFVPWGSDWTQMIWDFVVPSGAYTYCWAESTSIAPSYIGAMIAWFDVRPVEVDARVWFADPVIYIEPAGEPDPTPVPTVYPTFSPVPPSPEPSHLPLLVLPVVGGVDLGESVGVVALLTVVSSFMGALSKFKKV